MGMSRIHVSVSQAHAREAEAAQAAIERLIGAIKERFPLYNLTHSWGDDQKSHAVFKFEKQGRGHGGGRADLRPGGVQVTIDANFDLPFFVPVTLAEMKVRDELTKALREAFG
jgi:hypothetical protein